MSKRIVAVLLLFFLPVMWLTAASPRLKNAGFEEENMKHWHVFSHGQEVFVKIEQDAVDYVEGLHAAKITIGDTPRLYVGINQRFELEKNDRKINVSFFYKAPEMPVDFYLFFEGKKTPEPFHKVLPASEDWREVKFSAEIPENVRAARMEFRGSQKGSFSLDAIDMKVIREEADTDRMIDVLFVNTKRLSSVLFEGLQKAGFARIEFCPWGELTPEKLKRTRCVTLLPLNKMDFSGTRDQEKIRLLKEYVRQGGGLMLTQLYAQWYGNTILSMRMGDEFGLNILYEVTVFPKARIRLLGPQEGDRFAETSDIFPPLNEGVDHILAPAGTAWSLAGSVPFQGDASWKTVLGAGKGSRGSMIEKWGLELYQQRLNGIVPFADDVPIAGIREFGKGRVGYFGLNPQCTISMQDSGKQGRAIAEKIFLENNLLKFLINFYTWLGAGADNLASADLPAVTPEPEPVGTPRLYRGVIGPRTTYSSGKSTPSEYAEAAKKAGFDFIVFLEDFEHLSYENFEKLRAECQKLSEKDFLALPGFTYRNIDGNHQYIYGTQPFYPGPSILDESRKRFTSTTQTTKNRAFGTDLYYLYSMLSFQCNSGWYDFSHNPYPYHDMRSVCTMGAITQEDGKIIDESFAELAATNRGEQYIWPQALTLMKDASEMEWAKDGRYYHNELFANDFNHLSTLLSSLKSRMARNRYPGISCFGKMFLTQGPILTLDMPRGDMNPGGDLYASVLNYWPLKLRASAGEGIRTVELWDGDTLLKKFYPNGEAEFSYDSALPNDRQRHVWAKLETVDGKQAVTRCCSSDSWLMRDYYCMDRNNPLLYSLQYRKNGKEFFIDYAADGVFPWKGPWIGRIRALGAFVSDPELGAGKQRFDGAPENHPQPAMVPGFFKDGKLAPPYPLQSWQGDMVPDQEGAIHNHPYSVLFSSNVLIGRQTLDGVFGLGVYPIIDPHSSLFPFKKSEYLETEATRTLYLIKPEGVASWLWEQHFKILRDCTVTGEKKLFLTPGGISPRGAKLSRAWLAGMEVQNPRGVISLKKGDFLLYEGNFFGTLAIYILSDVSYYADADRFVYVAPEGEVKAGTEYDLKLVFSGIHRLVKDPFAAALKYGRDFGLIESGKTGYTVDVRKGNILANEFTLDLDGDFLGTINGLADCDGNLGLRLLHMNNNFSAMLGCGGKKRIIPVEEGIARAVVGDFESGKLLAVGHPFRADDPEIRILVSGNSTYTGWRAEIHNPTEKTITTTIRSNPDLTGSDLCETVTLTPGQIIVKEFQ